ncbi:MAG: GNAT family N-acetyltransferase [Opitutaceae bacterium]
MDNRFASAIPELPVVDLDESLRFFRDVLGFREDWTWESECASVSRGCAIIRLARAAPPVPRASLVIPVENADALHAEWTVRGATVLAPLQDKPWGAREFTIEEGNGHCLRVSQRLRVSPHVPRESLAGARIVKRLPTTGEYHAMVEAVRWTGFVNHEAAARSLSRSLFCVVAELEGRCIGMARVVGDGALFFQVMDVAVMPEHQGCGVGTQMMNRVVEYIRGAAPAKGLVGLFTGAGRASFYERFGFRGPENALLGMTASMLEQV